MVNEKQYNQLVGNRIKSARKERQLTLKELGALVGLSESTTQRYERGMIKSVDINVIKKFASALHVSAEDLLCGTTPAAPVPPPKVTRIPLLRVVAADIPMDAIENIEDYEEIPAEWGTDRDYFALRVKDDSMAPVICDNDRVIVRKQSCADSGQIAVVLVNGSDATVKKIKLMEKGLMLIGINTIVYQPHFYTAEEVETLPITILGRVVEVRRSIE